MTLKELLNVIDPDQQIMIKCEHYNYWLRDPNYDIYSTPYMWLNHSVRKELNYKVLYVEFDESNGTVRITLKGDDE